MALFGSIEEFRSALKTLVNTSVRSAKANRNPGARRNMAMMLDGIKFDTLEELRAYQESKRSSRGASATGWAPREEAPRRAAAAPKAPKAPRPAKERKERKPFDASAVSPEKAFGPPSYPQGRKIGEYIGRTKLPDVKKILTRFANYAEAFSAIELLERAKADNGGQLSQDQAVEILRQFVAAKANPRRKASRKSRR